jgi:hypothetical protein
VREGRRVKHASDEAVLYGRNPDAIGVSRRPCRERY